MNCDTSVNKLPKKRRCHDLFVLVGAEIVTSVTRALSIFNVRVHGAALFCRASGSGVLRDVATFGQGRLSVTAVVVQLLQRGWKGVSGIGDHTSIDIFCIGKALLTKLMHRLAVGGLTDGRILRFESIQRVGTACVGGRQGARM